MAQAVDVAELAFAVENLLRPLAADAERFAGGVAGERRVSSSSSLTGADQTLSSYLKSPIAFSDD